MFNNLLYCAYLFYLSVVSYQCFFSQSSTSALTKPIFLVSLIGLAAKKDTKEIMSEENQNFKDVDELLAQGEFEKALDLLRAFEVITKEGFATRTAFH